MHIIPSQRSEKEFNVLYPFLQNLQQFKSEQVGETELVK